MFKRKTAAVALALLIPVPALAAEPQIIEPTESQYTQYEMELKQFFEIPIFARDRGKYLRTSDDERRIDGQVYCSILNEYSVKQLLETRLASRRALYSDNPQKQDDESAYIIGVATSAIDTMCTEHRAELMDFLESVKQESTAAGTSSQNRKPGSLGRMHSEEVRLEK